MKKVLFLLAMLCASAGAYSQTDMNNAVMKGKDLAENFAQWFDELYLGKYDLIPYFKVSKIDDMFQEHYHDEKRDISIERMDLSIPNH